MRQLETIQFLQDWTYSF